MICLVPPNMIVWGKLFNLKTVQRHITPPPPPKKKKKKKKKKLLNDSRKIKIKKYHMQTGSTATDMTSIYESCKKSQVGYVLTCHSPRMLFCYCHDADHRYNEYLLKIFIGNKFSQKLQFYTFCPQKFALSSTLLNLLQNQII